MRTLKQPDTKVEKKVKDEKELDTNIFPKEVRLEGFGRVLLYSEPSGEDGVRLHLRDEKSILGHLPLADLPEPNIDILLTDNPDITLVGEEEGLELLTGGADLTLARGAESFLTDSSESISLTQPDHDTVDSSCEEGRSDGRAANRKPTKSSSPNRQGPQRCPVCGKVFGNASALAKHKLTHSDERRYVCSMCAKAFKRQDHLNGHMLTHRNKKPYECKAEGCGKSYCDARSLRRHTENHHSGSNSNCTTPEPSPPSSCIQYAPPPVPREQKVTNGKSNNSSETSHFVTSKLSEPSNSQVISSSCNTKSWIFQANQTISKAVVSSTKPVECNLCHRKFKNIPALNGHMRLHGGYFKKDTDPRRFEKRDANTPPLQTASISVRALIEEKIILKRITKPSSTTSSVSTKSEALTKAIQDNPIKQESAAERTSQESELLKQNESLLAAQLNHNNRTFSLDEYSEDAGILSPSLQGDVFHDGPDSVLLEGVDSSSLEESINAADLDDIAIEDYQSAGESLPSPRSFPHHQDVQSVLDSPLPANLAEFAYDHSQNTDSISTSQNFNTSTSNLSFTDPPISQSSVFPSKIQGVTSSSSNYYSPSITSTSGGVESTMIPPRTTLSSSSSQGCTLQSQMMPNSNDPLLSSSPKDYIAKSRKFDFHTLKLLHGGPVDHNTQTQNLTGIILDRNGDLKFIQSNPKKLTKTLPVKLENGTKLTKTLSTSTKTAFLKNGEKIGSVLDDGIKDGSHDGIFVTPSLNMTPVHVVRKRPRLEYSTRVQHRSRLRQVRRNYGSNPIHYTPPPVLPPSRQGPGLHWLAATASPTSTTLSKGSNWDETSEIPESDAKPHINIGPDYQCDIPDLVQQNNREKLKEHSLWDTKLSKIVSDMEVDKYLEFACCAAVPGGGRNKEHALHLLHICHGQIQEAILQLMQPTPWLPMGHPLLTFEYSDCEKWTLKEMESFHQALLKYDKDFSLVSREVSTKTAKQCVQFYYMWKKVCPDDYKRVRLLRKKYREPEVESESSKVDNQNGDADIVTTTSTEGRLFVCEYNDCSAGLQQS